MTKYGVILADPPWWYNSRKTGGERNHKTKFCGGAMKHYPLMKDLELLDMAGHIKDISDANSALFMWATMPRLDFGIELLKHWGFSYKTTAFCWVKTNPNGGIFSGPGFYTASNTELVLLGIKGSMPPQKKMISQIVMAPVQEHSRKPSIHRLINQMYPDQKKIELFARYSADGWDLWGNEAPESQQKELSL